MADKVVRTFGPAYLGTSAADVYNNTDSALYDVLTHIHVSNNSSSDATFSLYLSATTGTETAGKEIFAGVTVSANDVFDWYGRLYVASTDYVVGHASTGTTLTIIGEGVRAAA